MRKNVSVRKNYEEMSREAAEVMLNTIRENPEAAIVLATGHSPKLAYRYLVEKIREEQVDISRVTFVKLDEWLGLTAEDEATCEYFIQKEILEPLSVKKEQYLHFEPEAEDAEVECERIQQAYEKLPAVDLVILGIGMNGHLGLNEPAGELIGPAHSMDLDKKTKTHEMLTHAGGSVSRGVTLGLENIFSGKQVLLLADGAEKEKGLQYYLNEKITTEVPVSLLKLHPNCKCIINKESFPNLSELES